MSDLVYRIQPIGKPLAKKSKDTFVFTSLDELRDSIKLWRAEELAEVEVLGIEYEGPRKEHELELGTLIDSSLAKVVWRKSLKEILKKDVERYSGLIIKLGSKRPNLLTDYDDTLLLMAELEGDNWLDRQLHAGSASQYDVPGVLKWVKKRQQDFKEWEPDPEYPKDKPPDLKDTVGDAIYGAGGWHRYFVRGNGEVVFSGMHALNEDKEKARQLGFEIF